MLFDTTAPRIKIREPQALIALDDEELAFYVEPQIQTLGVRTEIISVKHDIIHALHSGIFDIIVLADSYEGGDMNDNEVLVELINWSSEKRRQLYCVLVGEEIETADELQSFLFSMDLVINVKDCENFGAYLQMGLGGKQESLAKLNDIIGQTEKI